jgi:hypothetical protein
MFSASPLRLGVSAVRLFPQSQKKQKDGRLAIPGETGAPKWPQSFSEVLCVLRGLCVRLQGQSRFVRAKLRPSSSIAMFTVFTVTSAGD